MPENNVRSQEWIDKIEALVHRAESLDAPARAVTIDLLQAVLDFHAAALDRMLEITAEQGSNLIEQFAGDDLASSMLLLHDLHPDDLETRVHRAVEKLAGMFRSLGAELALISIETGTVRLHFESVRSWSGTPVRASVETAIFQAAPEISTVIIEGLKEPAPANFVPVSNLLAGNGVNASHL
ncbi:MAG: hypothetical protein JO108_07155 [Acidobacteriaceae bacterium]|nr:hypothetical protein [Acidobacteriaceae bacterium]